MAVDLNSYAIDLYLDTDEGEWVAQTHIPPVTVRGDSRSEALELLAEELDAYEAEGDDGEEGDEE